jgi:nitrogenase molybdenum-iron protein alpha/beta subunit
MFSPPKFNIPFLNGVYIGIDAIPDVYLIVDGPYCVFHKSEMQKGHNPASTFISSVDSGRIAHTDLKFNANVVNRLVVERDQELERIFEEISSSGRCKTVFITSMDFHQLLDVPLEKISSDIQKRLSKPFYFLKSGSLSGDWLDGYSAVLNIIAENIDLKGAEPCSSRAAVIGNLFDRNEGDQSGNIQELKNLFKHFSVDVCSIWLSGTGYSELADVKYAGTIFSLPYGREAAKILADRLNIPHIPLQIPVGLTACCDFIRTLGKYFNVNPESFLRIEIERIIPAVRDFAFRHTYTRTAILIVDPFILDGMLSMMDDLGFEIKAVGLVGAEKHLSHALNQRLEKSEIPILSDSGKLYEILKETDLLISNTLPWCGGKKAAAWLPFGYPNYVSHPIRFRPFLGFEGFLCWVEKIVEILLIEKWKKIG